MLVSSCRCFAEKHLCQSHIYVQFSWTYTLFFFPTTWTQLHKPPFQSNVWGASQHSSQSGSTNPWRWEMLFNLQHWTTRGQSWDVFSSKTPSLRPLPSGSGHHGQHPHQTHGGSGGNRHAGHQGALPEDVWQEPALLYQGEATLEGRPTQWPTVWIWWICS